MGLSRSRLLKLEEIGIDIGLAREGDFRRLLVGAFAKAHANAVGEELLDVGLRAVEVSLDDDADGAAEVRRARERGARCRA